jgi:putative aldouronate transport system substrate-binding protein
MLAYAKAGGSALPDGFAFTAFPIPVKNEGDARKFSVGGASVSRKTNVVNCISVQCAQPEMLVKWFDYLYTEEGAVLANYGTLADGYTIEDIGKTNITEQLLYSADSMEAGLARFAAGRYQACLYDPFREYTPANRVKMEAVLKTFDTNWADEYTLPVALSLTESESIEYDLIMADVETYLEETFVRLITGEIPISGYDAMLANLEKMNCNRAEELWQKAYDRYLLLSK